LAGKEARQWLACYGANFLSILVTLIALKIPGAIKDNFKRGRSGPYDFLLQVILTEWSYHHV
jgi:hypothetical protein